MRFIIGATAAIVFAYPWALSGIALLYQLAAKLQEVSASLPF
jgi:hypothetical protein